MRTVVLTCDPAGKIPIPERDALTAQAAGISRLVLWTHGWATGSDASTEITDLMVAGLAPLFNDETLFVALHWPSDIAGDGSLLNLLELGSYYHMERLARLIGQTAGIGIVRDVAGIAGPIDVTCIGHSFGCIVAGSTLAEVGNRALPASARILETEAVFIQAAMPNDSLESGQMFGAIQRLYPRVKITISELDYALGRAFPLAEHLECRHDCLAMGFGGPTEPTRRALGDRLSMLDLTETHRQTPGWDGPSGHHSNIGLQIVFDFIASQ